MSDTFDPMAFLSIAAGDGDWHDEFLAWYEPGKWLSDEQACAAFIASRFARLQADRDSWYQQHSDRVDDAVKFAAQHDAAQAECAALRAFAQAIMGDWPDIGGQDGFELQMLGEEHGLIAPETRYAPCSEEGCRCAECVDANEWEKGVQCYRKTPLLTGGEK